MTDAQNEMLRMLGIACPEDDDKGEEISVPGSIRMAKGALDKAHAICNYVREAHGSPSEWYGLMVAKTGEPEVVRDVVIGRQKSSAAHTAMDGEEVGRLVAESGRRLGDEWMVNGWIHSHASFGTCFSSTDYDNMWKVLNSVYLNTRTPSMQPFRLIEGEKTVELDKERGVFAVKGSLRTDPQMLMPLEDLKVDGVSEEAARLIMERLARVKVRQTVLAGWSYSVVVNDAGDRAGHINHKLHPTLSGEDDWGDSAAGVEVLEGPGYELAIDHDALQAEVKEKVEKPWVVTYSYPSKGGSGNRRHARAKKSPWRFTAQASAPSGAKGAAAENLGARAEEFLIAAAAYAGAALPSDDDKCALYEILRAELGRGASSMGEAWDKWYLSRKTPFSADASYERRALGMLIDSNLAEIFARRARDDPKFMRFMEDFGGTPYTTTSDRASVIHGYAEGSGGTGECDKGAGGAGKGRGGGWFKRWL